MTSEAVLVTGASGFLGGHLVARLTERGVRPVCVSRLPVAGADRHWRSCDVTDSEAVDRLFQETRPTKVFHLASYVRGEGELASVLPAFRANLASTVNVLVAASGVGCDRVVLAASMEELPLDKPARFPYAVAKRAATEYGRFFQAAYGLSVISARIAMAYGPAQRDVTKLVPHVVLSQLDGRAPRLSSGDRRADWVYAADVADALIACMDTAGVGDSVVEIGTGHDTSVGEIAAQLTSLTGGPAPHFGALPDRPNEAALVANADETFRRLGWRAQVSLGEGLRRTVDWYRQERSAGR